VLLLCYYSLLFFCYEFEGLLNFYCYFFSQMNKIEVIKILASVLPHYFVSKKIVCVIYYLFLKVYLALHHFLKQCLETLS